MQLKDFSSLTIMILCRNVDQKRKAAIYDISSSGPECTAPIYSTDTVRPPTVPTPNPTARSPGKEGLRCSAAKVVGAAP